MDTTYNKAREKSADHEHDVITRFLEGLSYALSSSFANSIVVVAKLSGGAKEEESFLATYVDLIEDGTEYQPFRHPPLGIFTAYSRRIRLLQLADVITSCPLSRISSEHRRSEEVFELVKRVCRQSGERIGIRVKLHPDFVYANLYQWLLADSYIARDGQPRPLPDPTLPFADHPNEPRVTAEIIRAARKPKSHG